MVSRGFRHAHDFLKEPKFRRFRQEESNDLLPWADPYIASLFGEADDQSSTVRNENEPPLFQDDEEENPWHR